MSNLLWNALKVSPALFGASLLLAGSTLAAQTTPETAPVISESVTEIPVPVAAAPSPIDADSVSPATEASPLSEPATNLVPSTPIAQVPAADPGVAPDSTDAVLNQINQYNREFNNSQRTRSQSQVTNVSQLRDVSPGDWAFEALRSLVERYGCIVGYPDGTFRGNRALSRYEFAAGLNACLQQIERLIAASTADFATKEDLETLRRLVDEFRAELTALGTRVDALEGRVAFLEDNQFSTTTRLNAEAIFALGDAFGDQIAVASGSNPSRDLDVNTIFGDRVRLNFDTSFNGRDRLRTRLQSRNITPFSGSLTGTSMTRLAFDSSEDNDNFLSQLYYRFPLNSRSNVFISTTGLSGDDIAPTFNNLFASTGTGSISRYGQYNPIYRLLDGAGAGIDYKLSNGLGFSAAYLSGASFVSSSSSQNNNSANDPGIDRGIFNGQYGALAQLNYQPLSNVGIGFTYVRYYSPGIGADGGPEVNLTGSTGSGFATRPFGNGAATSANAFGIETSIRLSPRFILGGWAGYTQAIAESGPGSINRGDKADIWNYALTLALPDFGSKGNLLGFVAGVPPYLARNEGGNNRDRDRSYHLEAFYRLRISDNISITPGAFVILNPEHNDENDAIYVGTVRTTFTF